MANMFNEDGTYNKTEWKAGDKITATKLNKIELSLEAINNNDIDRHVEADSRLDILEERMANTPDNEQMDALEDMVKDNKDAADLAVYGINRKIESLENVNADFRLEVNDNKLNIEALNTEVNGNKLNIEALDTEINDIKSNHLSISVLDFGAIGDGITDDTHSIQSAIDSIADGVNSTLIFPSGYTFLISEIIINKTHMNICGGGEILNGHIYISFNQKTESYIKISNLTFRSTDRVGYGIMFNNTRRNTISDCHFINKNKALYVPPHIGNNIDGSDSLFHSVGLLNINDNFFSNIDYCFYVDFDTDEVSDTSDLSTRWMRTNDIHFTTNYINVMKRCAVWCRGVDGIIITGNTIFSDNYTLKSQHKEQNIYIGKADWVVINTNNLFESGMEAIKIDDCSRVNIVGNNIAWCGQRTPSSGISLGVYPNGIISNNIISKPTKYGIEITSGYMVVSNNLIEFDVNRIPSSYYGDTDEIMSIDEHYSIYSGGYCVHNSNMSTSAIYIKNRNSKTMDDKTGVSYYTLEETFVSGEIKPLLNLCDFSGISLKNKDTGGLLLIRVRLKPGSNAASYLLLFDNIMNKPGIIEIGKTGVVGTTQSTNWCNFTFSIENHQLYVTSDNSVGTYSFEITSLGNLGMGDL